jgi:hypothetical protein
MSGSPTFGRDYGGGAGIGSSGGLGLTTGNVWSGNTAFGPAGGTATGYATRSPVTSNPSVTGSSTYGVSGAGGSVGQGTYGNFRTPTGGAMFGSGPGAPGGVGVNARNAIQAMMMARLMQHRGKTTGGPGPVPAGGLLDKEKILGVEDLPPPGLEFNYNTRLPPGHYPGMYWRNPSYPPIDRREFHRYEGSAGTVEQGPSGAKGDFGGRTFPGKSDYGGPRGYGY